MKRHCFLPVRLVAALLVALLAAGAQAPAVALADDVAQAANDPVYAADQPPAVSSPAAFLVEASTGEVLLDKNADERREPASTTKIMTALVTIESVGPRGSRSGASSMPTSRMTT